MEKKYMIIWITALIAWVLFVLFFVVSTILNWDGWIRTALNSGMWVSNIVMWASSYFSLKHDHEKLKRN